VFNDDYKQFFLTCNLNVFEGSSRSMAPYGYLTETQVCQTTD